MRDGAVLWGTAIDQEYGRDSERQVQGRMQVNGIVLVS
jgi:hypothetical protein